MRYQPLGYNVSCEPAGSLIYKSERLKRVAHQTSREGSGDELETGRFQPATEPRTANCRELVGAGGFER
ncbi:hypothetical protein [Desulfosporosinus metallidurans]|uniref:hypothetical protein n=1 Tax=Desulfosporosinus metallidurans TaxID=1888891 RepID=UPI00148041BB|nr:hypothetical protein [Desulfosporosinus metallidurans]